ncbi:MAG: polyphosphate kinase 2 family protein [Chthonomonadales bacterium]|nr:polyphosphate kinase 2 family protein [Chthonomonadales bacterium]
MAHAIRIDEGEAVRLDRIEADATGGMDRAEAEKRTDELGAEMAELHDLLFYAGGHGLLVVLQGRDTSGKDGLIRALLRYVNAQSCRVVPFKVPTPEQTAHDFLWRVHVHTPGRGEIALFNRSHYEDVLVARVHGLVPERVWRPRYDHINHFESLLADADTIIAKFYLHISRGEQEERLRKREQDTTKAWKLSAQDWRERELWDRYTEAYEEALSRCSTARAPWHIVPADRKWFRNLAVTEALVRLLRPYRPIWMERLEAIGRTAKRDLEEYRSGSG